MVEEWKDIAARYIIISMLIFLGGCSTTLKQPPPETIIVYQDRKVKIVCPLPPDPEPVTMLAWVPTLIETESGEIWVATTIKHYENMAINIQDILRFIRNRSSIVEYFEKCTKES